MAYEYNPLLKLDLQKKSEVSPADLKQKVPKIISSIAEIKVGEIGQKQDGSDADMTEGFFYKRGEGLPIEYEEITIPVGSKKIIYTNKFDATQQYVYAFNTVPLSPSALVNYLQQGRAFLLDDTVHGYIINNTSAYWILDYPSIIATNVNGLIYTQNTFITHLLLQAFVNSGHGTIDELRECFKYVNDVYLYSGFRLSVDAEATFGRLTDILLNIAIPIKKGEDEGWSYRTCLASDFLAVNWVLEDYIALIYPLTPSSEVFAYDASRQYYFYTTAVHVVIETEDGLKYVLRTTGESGQRADSLYQTVSEDGEQTKFIDISHLNCVFESTPVSSEAVWATAIDVDLYFNYDAEIVDVSESVTIRRRIPHYDENGLLIVDKPAIERVNTQPSLDPADYATAVQGAKADTALQSISVGTDGNYITTTIGTKDANNNQTVGVSAKIQDIATADNDNKGFAESSNVKAYAATAAQGAKADTALQSISHGTDGNYVTSHIGTKDANNVQTVDVSLQLQAVESADVSHKGVAEANDVKEYVSKSIASYIPYNPIYGVMWDTADPSPECVRIGNLDLHRTLPVQSQMVGGTLTDAGVFTPFASVDDWTSETRDGSAGQVMVRLPQFWIKYVTEGTVNKVLISADEVSGFQKVPVMYVSAYKAALQRSTLKLASVVNTDADYRGGNNQSAWDGTYRSLLGYPATNISLTDFRTYARNRAAGTEWNCAVYEIHKLLYWLFVVEYATLNTQKDFNAALDANGYHQGGLGVGVTDWSGDAWNSFNGYYPLIPCGHTDEYGNQTAQKQYNLYGSDGTTILHSFQVPRYRGVESPYGDIWELKDGVLIPKQADSNGGKSPVYVTSDPAKFSSTDYSQYDYVCDEIRSDAYVKSIYFGNNGDLICTAIPGSSTSYYCDYWYGANLPSSGVSLRALLCGGAADYGARAGFVFGYSGSSPGFVLANIGSRLCFIPNTV